MSYEPVWELMRDGSIFKLDVTVGGRFDHTQADSRTLLLTAGADGSLHGHVYDTKFRVSLDGPVTFDYPRGHFTFMTQYGPRRGFVGEEWTDVSLVEDALTALAVWQDGLKEQGRMAGFEVVDAAPLDYVIEVFDVGDSFEAVATHTSGEIIGLVRGLKDGTSIEPEGSTVIDGRRGEGIGTALYRALYEFARVRGFTHVAGHGHSDAAGRVHESLARRYGYEYEPGYASDTDRGGYIYSLNPHGLKERGQLAGFDGNEWKVQAAAAAQAVYDSWLQDEEGFDEVYGGGGICDDVADAVAGVLSDAGYEATTFHYEQDNHTVVIAKMDGKTVEVDIPLHIYETGGWYSYRKVPGVVFTPEHITIVPVGSEEAFDTYFDGVDALDGVDDFRAPTKAEIVEVLRAHPLIKLRERVKRAFLVGSYAKGLARPRGSPEGESDVDILLEVSPRAGFTPEQLEEKYRQPLRNYFMQHRIMGKADHLHPQWMGRRVDMYFTYDAQPERRPKVEL